MNDIEYKRALLRGLGESEEHLEKLEAIAGKQEFLEFLNYAKDKPELYTAETNDFQNVKDAIFQGNFHIHTTNSDGVMSIEEFLDLGAKYADKFVHKNKNKKVYLAITDHDTVNGDIEALKIIIKNPQKYKNLRIILGVEMSSAFSSPYMSKTRDAHLLHYCLNPFDHPVTELNQERLNLLYIDINEALNGAREKYSKINGEYNITYSLEEIIKMRPQLKLFPHDARLTLKDYMQFKLLFADLVTENKEIMELLEEQGIKKDTLDFTIPKFMIKKSEKSPYWLNYVEKTREYIEGLLKNKNPKIIDEFKNKFGKVSDKVLYPLETMETEVLNPASPLYIKYDAKLVEFETVVRFFGSKEYTLSGIAHPAHTLRGEINNPNKKLIIHDFFSKFKEYLGQDNMTIEQHYPYLKEVPTSWINMVNYVADFYPHIPSGGRDSHRNSFFTRDIWLSKSELNELTQTPYSYINIENSRG